MDYRPTAGLTTSFAPVIIVSVLFFFFFFKYNPLLAFLRFVRNDRLSVLEVLTRACPSALKYQMVYLCWYCRSVGSVNCWCVCVCVFICMLERGRISLFSPRSCFYCEKDEKDAGVKGFIYLFR